MQGDYWLAIKEHDEREFIKLQQFMVEMRDHYVSFRTICFQLFTNFMEYFLAAFVCLLEFIDNYLFALLWGTDD